MGFFFEYKNNTDYWKTLYFAPLCSPTKLDKYCFFVQKKFIRKIFHPNPLYYDNFVTIDSFQQ